MSATGQTNTSYLNMPNVVRPGMPKNYNADKILDLHQLDSLGATAAVQIRDGYMSHLAEHPTQKNLITNQLLALQRMYEMRRVKSKSGNNLDDLYGVSFGNSYSREKIDLPDGEQLKHYMFKYRLKNPKRLHYKVIVAPANVNGRIGQGGNTFTFTMQGGTIAPEEWYVLGNLTTVIFVTRVTNATAYPGAKQVTAFLADGREFPNKYIDASLLAAGQELMRIGNVKSFKSTFGSSASIQFDDWARGYIGFSRWQWGNDISAKLASQKSVYTATPTKGECAGKEVVFSVDMQREIVMKQAMLEMDRKIFYGVGMRDENKGFFRDARGGEYITDDGILRQANPRMFYQYSRMNTDMFEFMLEKAQLTSPYATPTVLVLGGDDFVTNFSKMIASVFQYDPKVLYFDSNSNEGAVYMPDNARGINTAFNAYTTPKGNIIVMKCPYLSGPNALPGRTLPNGKHENSSKAYWINVTEEAAGNNMGGGIENISMFKFIPHLEGTINGFGMDGKIASHSRMESEHHFAHSCHALLHDKNAFGMFEMVA